MSNATARYEGVMTACFVYYSLSDAMPSLMRFFVFSGRVCLPPLTCTLQCVAVLLSVAAPGLRSLARGIIVETNKLREKSLTRSHWLHAAVSDAAQLAICSHIGVELSLRAWIGACIACSLTLLCARDSMNVFARVFVLVSVFVCR